MFLAEIYDMVCADYFLSELNVRAKPDQLEGMVRYGIEAKKEYHIFIPELRILTKEIEKAMTLYCNCEKLESLKQWNIKKTRSERSGNKNFP